MSSEWVDGRLLLIRAPVICILLHIAIDERWRNCIILHTEPFCAEAYGCCQP